MLFSSSEGKSATSRKKRETNASQSERRASSSSARAVSIDSDAAAGGSYRISLRTRWGISNAAPMATWAPYECPSMYTGSSQESITAATSSNSARVEIAGVEDVSPRPRRSTAHTVNRAANPSLTVIQLDPRFVNTPWTRTKGGPEPNSSKPTVIPFRPMTCFMARTLPPNGMGAQLRGPAPLKPARAPGFEAKRLPDTSNPFGPRLLQRLVGPQARDRLPIVTQSVMLSAVIRSFADGETEKGFLRERSRRLPPDAQRRAHRKLLLIDAADAIGDLRVPPGNRLERLSGDRADQYSIRINEQWRICFRWSRGDAHDVEITDYHRG